MRKKRTAAQQAGTLYALLAALSDDLALPLLQIKGTTELIPKKTATTHTEQILLSADNGLQLIEAYRLVLKAVDINSLQFEPVAVGAVLQDVAHQLSAYAKKYNTELEVNIQPRLTPVLAHKASLMAALQVLSSSMIRVQAAAAQQSRYTILLGAHRSAQNVISTGVFSSVTGLSDRTLRSARGLVGRARKPIAEAPAGAASGILIADMLCSAMWQPLRAAAHGGLHGLATSVPISKQLQII